MSQPRWDLAVRLSHWTLAIAVATCWWTGEEGIMDIHQVSGYVVLGTVVFRLLWGVFGSENARFLRFPIGPSKVVAYLRGLGARSSSDWPGHNPGGALMVLLMLAYFGTQAALGLFTTDEILVEGPLVAVVSSGVTDGASGWHHRLGEFVPWLVGLHVVAVLFHWLWKRDNLIPGMVTGRHERLTADALPRLVSFWWAAATALVAAAAVTALVQWGRSQGF